ncbi:hypothetical protein [Sphingomonas sp. Leaf10]|uniref:hypothetical protein n=1 Tax=Sphingomonas sp. Leaf10 TaxID=1735676 RepID=UPI0006F3D2DD|nr:hypothetical protein [Sphingomonas sp. Leaf10]KQM41322.1 hypothetical protein ASE59_03355 [Sphingomonas sp. Leaf10]
MRIVRHLLAQRRLAVLLCAAALLLKLIVPTGYMLSVDHGRVAIMVCPGTVPAQPVMHHGDMAGHHAPADKGKGEMPCAFAGLSAAALGAIDPILLVTLVAFVLATGWRAVVQPLPARPAYLRPPLRGPPRFV